MNSFGFIGAGGALIGFAKDIEVSTSPVLIPVLGIGLIGDSKFIDAASNQSSLRVYLETPILNDLYVDLKNITTGSTLSGGYLHVASGSTTAKWTSTLIVNSNDQVFLSLVLSSGNPQIVSVSWQTNL